MEALSSLETILQAGLAAAALAVASWSARRTVSSPPSTDDSPSTSTGELAWILVAVGVLAWVSVAAGFGIGRGV